MPTLQQQIADLRRSITDFSSTDKETADRLSTQLTEISGREGINIALNQNQLGSGLSVEQLERANVTQAKAAEDIKNLQSALAEGVKGGKQRVKAREFGRAKKQTLLDRPGRRQTILTSR